MKKTFSTRRVPRKVGGDDDEAAIASTSGSVEATGIIPKSPSDATAHVKRPVSDIPATSHCTELTDDECTESSALRRPTSKARKVSSVRTSFGPSTSEDEEAEEAGRVVAPKRSNLSRIAIQRNASKRSSLLVPTLPAREEDNNDDTDDRPSYTAASLQELKASTPSTPLDLSTPSASNTDVEDAASRTQALDLSSKFGSSLARYQEEASAISAIPSAAEIAEKKARRARLAKEQAADEYISLDPDDPNLDNSDAEDLDPNVMRDDAGRLVLKPKDEDKYGMAESRLVRDDEDMMEGFDDFTEDGKVHLGRKAEVEAAKRRKQEMAAQIAEAEDHDHADSDDSDVSEKERNAAFEAAQTRHGAYGATSTHVSSLDSLRPKTPPIITPIPTLDSVLERLRKQVVELQSSRMRKMREMDALRREKVRLGEEEVRIQRALRETAEKFRELRRERGVPVEGGDDTAQSTPLKEIGGADILSLTAKEEKGDEASNGEEIAEEDDGGEEGEGPDQQHLGLGAGHAGLGSGFAGLGARGLGSTPGMGVPGGGDEENW